MAGNNLDCFAGQLVKMICGGCEEIKKFRF